MISAPRLYFEGDLRESPQVWISGADAHYLLHVLRVKIGDALYLFDNHSGEWLAHVTDKLTDKRKDRLLLLCKCCVRALEPLPDIFLCFAPIKKARLDWMIEKATELGVAHLIPTITERSIIRRVNRDRIHALVAKASAQCGATTLPVIEDAVGLDILVARLAVESRRLFFADETVEATDSTRPLAAMAPHSGPAALIIGPEGGFTPRERMMLTAQAHVVCFSLGHSILRAETAALASLTLWHALCGARARGGDGKWRPRGG